MKLTAILTYREDVEKQVLYECMAMVYPRMTGSDEALLEKVRRTGNTFLYGNELERCSNYGGCSCDFRAVFCAG